MNYIITFVLFQVYQVSKTNLNLNTLKYNLEQYNTLNNDNTLL